jgi:2-keto-4-pentenoate hydratase/2-oxohepta-3-ene-1,7-dioic acid hydratase in catechol pathway
VKLCRFDDDRFGVLQGGRVSDVTDAVGRLDVPDRRRPTGDALVASLPGLRSRLEDACRGALQLALGSVRLRAPVADPPRVIAVRTNYPQSAAKPSGSSATPDLFLKSSTSVIGPADGVTLRFPDRRTDHEVELVAVIGCHADGISVGEALGCVAGYCVGIDLTLRGDEDRGLRKSLDGYTVLGPWLTTADEAGDVRGRRITLSVNSVRRQDGNTSDMLHGVAEIVSNASRYFALRPGDVIMTGTPAGAGPVEPGDVIDCAVEGLGEMRVAVNPLRPGAVADQR